MKKNKLEGEGQEESSVEIDAFYYKEKEAKLNLKYESKVESRNYSLKALYFGLKVNHPRHVAVVHPLAFLLRRVIYACIIVLLDKQPLIGSFGLMLTCLFMLGYVFTEF